MGEQFYATDKEGNPKQWDPADIGRILGPLPLQHDEPRHRRAASCLTRAAFPSFETLALRGATTASRRHAEPPEVHNAFNSLMQRELHALWRGLRRHDDVRCIVLTGAGEKAFCTGIDRMEQMGGERRRHAPTTTSSARARRRSCSTTRATSSARSRCDLWKPVIAAVNGMACGGAFYMLGEVEFIIAAEHATFFDPHVTYGMAAAFEPIHMAGHHAVRRDHAALAARQPRAHVGGSGRTRSAWCQEVVAGDRARETRATWVADDDRVAADARDRRHRARDLVTRADARHARGRSQPRLRVRRDGHRARTRIAEGQKRRSQSGQARSSGSCADA